MLNLYGIIISVAIFVSLKVAGLLVAKKNEEILWGLSFWTILLGILGARIYHVIDYFNYYSQNPIKILEFWNGGLGIWGAIAGGAVGATIYLKTRKEKILPWLDVLSVVVPLGQAIGRWGNFFNKEIFGLPTTLPWGIYVSPLKRPEGFINKEKFHPIFIYESILNIFLFAFLFSRFKKAHGKYSYGVFTATYLAGYSLIRFFMEFLRLNSWKIRVFSNLSLNVAQGISILVLTLSIVFILFTRKRN